MKHFALLAVILLTACGSTTEPVSRTPRLGQYTYASPISGNGTLTITFASADSIAGTWNTARNGVPEMQGAGELGFFNTDAYALYGVATHVVTGIPFQTRYAHRIARNGDAMSCTVQYVGNSASMQPCTLTYAGP